MFLLQLNVTSAHNFGLKILNNDGLDNMSLYDYLHCVK